MIKPLLVKTSRYLIALSFLLALFGKASAQTEADAIMIPKHYLCAGVMYGHSSWDHYWEGTFKRDNGNIGTLTTQMYGLMASYGVSNKLNLLVSAPYVTTHASAGTLKGQKGVQDLVASVKYMPVEAQVGKGVISLYAIGGVSVPLTNYVADFLPMSIGMHSTNIMGRILADYQLTNFFVTGSAQYVRRGNIKIDRYTYYDTELHYTNEVKMPNVAVYNFRTGYRSETWIAEAVVENNTTLGGFDIRKNDMPFPSNKMNFTTAGVNFKYSFNKPAGLELTAGGDYVLHGRNVGQTTMIHGGIYYLFSVKKEKK